MHNSSPVQAVCVLAGPLPAATPTAPRRQWPGTPGYAQASRPQGAAAAASGNAAMGTRPMLRRLLRLLLQMLRPALQNNRTRHLGLQQDRTVVLLLAAAAAASLRHLHIVTRQQNRRAISTQLPAISTTGLTSPPKPLAVDAFHILSRCLDDDSKWYVKQRAPTRWHTDVCRPTTHMNTS